ncbi:hypothetical protein KVP70_32810, partial [Duganella sp. HSC-15S17]
MMATDLLLQLHEKGVTLSLSNEQDQLRIRGKDQALDDVLMTTLRSCKPVLIGMLKSGEYARYMSDLKKLGKHLALPPNELTAEQRDGIAAQVSGGAANIQDIYPLAPLQEGILFHHRTQRDGDPYLLPVLMEFDTRDRLDCFLAALQQVIARHDILRTAIVWDNLDEPLQVVWRSAPMALEEVSFDAGAGAFADQLAQRYDPRHFRIDVRQAPLMRGFMGEDRHSGRWLLQLLTHHLAMDHTTLAMLVEEIRMIQLGLAAQLPPALPFRHFVAQARLGVSRHEHETFFSDMLADIDEPTAPYGVIDVLGDGSDIEEASLEIAQPLLLRLRRQAREQGVSLASVMHLAWAQVLSKLTGRQDVVFGTVLFGRMDGGDGAERVLGMFINTLPVRVSIDDQSVAQGVRRTHALLTQLLRHEHAPLSTAQRCSGVAAPLPLFSTLLNYRHAQASDAGSAETEWPGVAILKNEERTNFPFMLSVNDHGNALSLSAQVKRVASAERVCQYMQTALEGIVAALETAPQTALAEIGVLSAAERRQVLVEWNATAADYEQDVCLHELF